MSEVDYVKGETAKVYTSETGDTDKMTLLWGDRVRVYERGAQRTKIKARSRYGYSWIDNEDLGGEPLLELYFIDVGQGDGTLIVTPGRRHLLVDGGWTREYQPTGKNAADFVDWKFYDDYGEDEIRLDCMIASHCDADHYGGLRDLLDRTGERAEELDTQTTTVDAFYHAGVSWWKDDGGPSRYLGPKVNGKLTRLLGDQDDLARALSGQDGYRPQGQWGEFLQVVSGEVPVVRRLSHLSNQSGCLPNFRPQDGDVTIRVYGPIEDSVGNSPALSDLGSDSYNTNGHSIILRLDYGDCRILLTGDLNEKSHELLLDHYGPYTTRFKSDVAKACHHGSDKVSYRFLQRMNATATIVSSGDNESHSHPRPSMLAASATTGYRQMSADGHTLHTPLLYCTEIARSVALGKVNKATMDEHASWDFGGEQFVIDEESGPALAHYKGTKSGAFSTFSGKRSVVGSSVLHQTIYGLVNVRTNGEKILFAIMDEKFGGWEVETTTARF